MIPTVGITYKFSFAPGYTALDGIYHVGQILTFQEMIQSENSLINGFYMLVDKTSTDYNNDLAYVRESKIVKLMNPDTLSDSSAIYAPLYYLSMVPDPNVKKYFHLSIGFDLGIYDDPEQLSFISTNLAQQFQATLGIINASPEIFELESTWMTTDTYITQYKDIRQANIKEILNYFSENKRLELEIASLRSKLKAYEEIIVDHIPPSNGG